MNFKMIIIIFITGIFFYAIGFFTNQALPRTKQIVSAPKNCESFYNDGWQDANKRMKQIGVHFINPQNVEIKILSGNLAKITGNELTLEIKQFDPFADPVPHLFSCWTA